MTFCEKFDLKDKKMVICGWEGHLFTEEEWKNSKRRTREIPYAKRFLDKKNREPLRVMV